MESSDSIENGKFFELINILFMYDAERSLEKST